MCHSEGCYVWLQLEKNDKFQVQVQIRGHSDSLWITRNKTARICTCYLTVPLPTRINKSG